MTPAIDDGPVTVYNADVLAGLAEIEAESVQTVVTSPPYWGLRDYGTASWDGGDSECDHASPAQPRLTRTNTATMNDAYAGGGKKLVEVPAVQYVGECGKCGASRVDQQIGLESSPDEFLERMIEVFREVRRVLRKDGTLWLNMGDSFAASRSGPVGDNSTLDGGDPNHGRHYREAQASSRFAGRSHTRERFPELGVKPKDLIGVPWLLAFALRADGWWLRSDIIWSKPNPMPESVTDRPTRAHEYLFLLTKAARYYYDADAIRTPFSPETKSLSFETMDFARRDGYKAGERPLLGPTVKNADKPPQDGHRRLVESVKMARAAGGDHEQPFGLGANARSVWTIATRAYPDAHFATFPEKLVEPCIKAGSREGDLVLDPFAGSGTTLAVARRLGRRAVGIELNPEYVELIRKRVGAAALPLLEEIT